MPAVGAPPSCCGPACREESSAPCRRPRWPSWSSSRSRERSRAAAPPRWPDQLKLERGNETESPDMPELEIRNLHVRAGATAGGNSAGSSSGGQSDGGQDILRGV